MSKSQNGQVDNGRTRQLIRQIKESLDRRGVTLPEGSAQDLCDAIDEALRYHDSTGLTEPRVC